MRNKGRKANAALYADRMRYAGKTGHIGHVAYIGRMGGIGHIRIAALLALLLFLPATGGDMRVISPLQAQDFLRLAPDIPLAPGLQETDTGAFLFDKPEGRILAGEALTARPVSEVLDFYRTTLPNLGWRQVDKDGQRPDSLYFVRGRERLTLVVEGGVVFFNLQPDMAR